jgi:hypothetical protein
MTRRRHKNDSKPKRTPNLWAKATSLAMKKLKIPKGFVAMKKGTKLYLLTRAIYSKMKKK